MKIINVLYVVGALLLLAGAVSRMFLPQHYAYIYSVGALLFAVTQFLLRPRNGNLAVRRLVRQQQLAGVLFIVAGLLMFTHEHNEWMAILTCGAMIELYTAFRIPREIENDAK